MKGLIEFARINERVYKKQNRLFSFVLAFCSFILVQYFNMAYNPYLNIQSDEEIMLMGVDINNILIPAISMFMVILMFFVIMILCQNFLNRKNLEEVILSLGGVGLNKIALYLFLQLFFTLIRAIPLGILLFLVFNPIFNFFVCQVLHVTYPLGYVSSTASWLSIVVIITLLLSMIITSTGYVYRHELIQLLEILNKKNKPLPVSHLRMPSFFYVIVFILPIFAIPPLINETRSIILMFLISMIGYRAMIKKTLPKLFVHLRLHFLQGPPLVSMAFSQATMFIQQISGVLAAQFISVNIIMVLLHSSRYNQGLLLICWMTYIILMITIFLTMIYKNAENESYYFKTYQTIYHLGYSMKEISKLIGYEFIFMFVLFMVGPMIYAGVILQSSGYMGLLDVMLIFLLFTLLVLVILYHQRKSLLTKIQNGGELYE